MTRLRHSPLVTSVLASHALVLALGALLNSPVIDEVAHLASGVSHWQIGQFALFKVNPPLVRMVAALPALISGVRTDRRNFYDGLMARPEFTLMDDFVDANSARIATLVVWGRLALLPFGLLGGYVCFRWAGELYGHAAGLMALALWCFCPNILAYAQILTADAGAAALGVTAGYCFWKWLRNPACDRAILAGVALGLAELTKTTWVVLFGLWPLLWVVVRCPWRGRTGLKSKTQIPRCAGEAAHTERRTEDVSNPDRRSEPAIACRWWAAPVLEFGQLSLMLALGVFCINAGYDFEGSGSRLRDYVFVSQPLARERLSEQVDGGGNQFAKCWLGSVPVPLPRNYVEGIDLQWHDIERGKPSYLRGRWNERGWWYWYLYALGVKVPLGTWGLLLLTMAVRIAAAIQKSRVQSPKSSQGPKSKVQSPKSQIEGPKPQGWKAESHSGQPWPDALSQVEPVTWRDELVLLAPAVVVLVLVSSQTGFSRYIRYVLPMFPFVFIWISSVAGVCRVRFKGVFGRLVAVLVRRRECETEGGAAAEGCGDESPRSTIIGMAVVGLLTWSIASSLWYAPHWMSYFNELAGGPMGGPAHLIDAQVDWGQDLLYLKKWLDAHPEARPLGLVYFGPINPALAGVDFFVPPKAVVDAEGTADRQSSDPQSGAFAGGERAARIVSVPDRLKPGWYAVSVNFLYGYPHYIIHPSGEHDWLSTPCYSYFRRFKPFATAGYSIYIYHVTAADIASQKSAAR